MGPCSIKLRILTELLVTPGGIWAQPLEYLARQLQKRIQRRVQRGRSAAALQYRLDHRERSPYVGQQLLPRAAGALGASFTLASAAKG